MEERRNLFFQHSDGSHSLLLKDCTKEEAAKKMGNFLHEHGYKAPYVRSWEKDGIMKWDVGSWCESFKWAEEGTIQNYYENDKKGNKHGT